MSNLLQKRWHGYRSVWVFLLQLLLVIVVSYYQWIVGLILLCLVLILNYGVIQAERRFHKELTMYVTNLTYRVKRVEGEALEHLPFGIILYSSDLSVEWHNHFVSVMYDEQTLVGASLSELLPSVSFSTKDKKSDEPKSPVEVSLDGRFYELVINEAERLIYIHDITELTVMREQYEGGKAAIGIVMLDNLDEATQGMDDQQRTSIIARVTTVLTDWAKQNNLYLRRLNSERSLMILDQRTLAHLEQSRFVILDEVREMTADLKVPMTLSIGLATGVDSYSELGELAGSSLDMALGRGGDQAAVKVGQRLSFYGGKTNAIEKRTRVRARVIAHALRDLMQESDRVIIMGHRVPDLDAIGASVGVLKAADMFKVEAHVVLDGPNPSIERLMERIEKDEALAKRFISPEQALGMMTEHTLLVLVDTHKASIAIEPKLVERARRVVVVDHHRRGEEFVNDAVLVYLEPYASSASELVTELLQYIHEKVVLSPLEATTLLAGITVDTKHFALHTGSRTFEAAAFLRRIGADTVMVQRLLKEDLQEYIAKADIIKHARIIHGHIALAVTEEDRKIPQLLIAQVADTLLNMTNILASFVICERPDGLIGISARSLGTMNVQVVMERLGGGGHLTNAAVQLEGTQAEAEKRLLEVLDEIDQEEGLFE